MTDPTVLAAIMGRGEGAMDKAALVYAPINRMCDPHGSPNLLTSKADDTWKAIRKAVAVSFSMQVRGSRHVEHCQLSPPGTAVAGREAGIDSPALQQLKAQQQTPSLKAPVRQWRSAAEDPQLDSRALEGRVLHSTAWCSAVKCVCSSLCH